MSTKTTKTKETDPQLNPKQLAVVKKIAEGHSATQAYLEVYAVKNSDVAGAAAARMLGNVRVQDALQNMLVEAGIGMESITEVMTELRNQRDWRAKDAFLKHMTNFFDLGKSKGDGGPVAQVGNIVNNWVAEK